MVNPLNKTKLTVPYQDVLEIRDKIFYGYNLSQEKHSNAQDAKYIGKKTSHSVDYYRGMMEAYGKSMHLFDKLSKKMSAASMAEHRERELKRIIERSKRIGIR